MVDILLFTKSLWLQGENSTQMGTERKKKKEYCSGPKERLQRPGWGVGTGMGMQWMWVRSRKS